MPNHEIEMSTFEELKQMSGSDFINELITTFLEDAPHILQDMKSALQARDADAFRRAAHSFKSNSATFGAKRMADLARELELIGKEGRLKDVGSGLQNLEQVYKVVADELKSFAGMTDHAAAQLLVVDDNRVNRLLLARGLEQQGHQVTQAENGRQALELLKAKPFDLLLLDIEMPELDGFQVLAALLQDPGLSDVPVIMTSASDELDRVVKCIEMGAEDYLTKPLNPVLLRARVNATLEKKRLRDQQLKLFRTFATPQVAETLLRDGFALGGKFVDATAMFADIRSFTSIAESQNPADTIALLNDYFALMFDAITNHGGTVNQMIGDGLMAVFGAPLPDANHCQSAVRAAMEMLEDLVVFNTEQSARQMPVLSIGIGIASGSMIAGYTGTQQRATYTCVGDTVNLAARIEAHTKVAGKPVLFDDSTRKGLQDGLLVEELGPVLFKGKQKPVAIFTLAA